MQALPENLQAAAAAASAKRGSKDTAFSMPVSTKPLSCVRGMKVRVYGATDELVNKSIHPSVHRPKSQLTNQSPNSLLYQCVMPSINSFKCINPSINLSLHLPDQLNKKLRRKYTTHPSTHPSMNQLQSTRQLKSITQSIIRSKPINRSINASMACRPLKGLLSDDDRKKRDRRHRLSVLNICSTLLASLKSMPPLGEGGEGGNSSPPRHNIDLPWVSMVR